MKNKILTVIICLIITLAIFLTGCTENNNIVINNEPIAKSDYSIVDKNSNNTLINVLDNDNDPDGDLLTITVVSEPENGLANISGGNIYYTPNVNFSGIDVFTYTISDGENPVTGTVTIFISRNNPIVVIDTTMGTMSLELFEDKVPITVANFVKLANDGFYEGLIFHRVKDDFMIQAGLQTVDGTIKTSPYDPINLETHPSVTHEDGAISMARTNDPNSATAQFFICDGAQNFLDGSYGAFGVVINGIQVVRDIAAIDHDGSLEPNPGGGKPLTDIIINSIIILYD
jgi:cyclophilin family peptidyl-prolyl cis-trans isomerase